MLTSVFILNKLTILDYFVETNRFLSLLFQQKTAFIYLYKLIQTTRLLKNMLFFISLKNSTRFYRYTDGLKSEMLGSKFYKH